jgi:hypothetical protein
MSISMLIGNGNEVDKFDANTGTYLGHFIQPGADGLHYSGPI